jgi:hypothetical protein
MRDCGCCKRCLRWIGHDEFDDFELTVLVHEVTLQANSKHTLVRLKAGAHQVETDPSKQGIFQQPLLLTVEQGVRFMVIELLSPSRVVLATLPLEISDVLNSEHPQSEVTYNMRQKNKSIRNPRVKLSMIPNMSSDVEQGFAPSAEYQYQDYVVRQHLNKCREQEGEDSAFAEIEALKQGCTGPLQIFEGLGGHSNVYVTVLGPPQSRRWVFGIWGTKQEFDTGKEALIEVDLMKVQSIQHDPGRKKNFVISHMIDRRTNKEIRFTIVDRSRDVWVSFLKKTMERARDYRKAAAAARTTGKRSILGGSALF